MSAQEYDNPLDKFKTYSYHFVMTVASTTGAFKKMVDNNGKNLLSTVSSVSLGEEIKLGNESAYLIVDTRRFSQYSITSVEMEHMYGTGPASNPSVPSSEMKIKLIDTTGLTFFSFLMKVFKEKLRTTRASAFFLLSIVFTGHRDDGTVETISTCHIPLTLLQLDFTFTSQGAEFNLEMLETLGAPQNGSTSQQIAFLGNVSSITTQDQPAGNTLGGLIDDLEYRLNLQSFEHFLKYKNEALAGVSNKNKQVGKLVQYMITMPSLERFNWRQFKCTRAAQSKVPERTLQTANRRPQSGQTLAEHQEAERKAKEQQAAQTAQQVKADQNKTEIKVTDAYSQISFPGLSTIPNAIKTILESSIEFTDLMSEQNLKNGQAISYKLITSLTADKSTYLIHYDIFPYFNQLHKSADKTVAGQSGRKNLDLDNANEFIQYNYIFTGKNTHIKDMKIEFSPAAAMALDTNVDLGRSRAADMAARGQTKSAVEGGSGGATKTVESNILIREDDPIFIPLKTAAQQNNNSGDKTETTNPADGQKSLQSQQEYASSMAKFNFLSALMLELSIRGNPKWIEKFSNCKERGLPNHPSIISSDILSSLSGIEDITKKYNDSKVGQNLASAKIAYIKEFVEPKILAVIDRKAGANDPLLNGRDPAVTAPLIKVNIKAPNVDIMGNHNQMRNEQGVNMNLDGTNALFTASPFYSGPYRLLQLRTTLTGGDFTQHLTLMPADPGAGVM